MRYLLDVNLLIALLDSDHTLHNRAHHWWTAAPRSWASCPITENGLVRIMSSHAYNPEDPFPVSRITELLVNFAGNTDHVFWADSLTIRDLGIFHHPSVISSKQVTDIYLLALAAKNGGTLVTFDQHIAFKAVTIANSSNLQVI